MIQTVMVSALVAVASGCSVPILQNDPVEQSAYEDLQQSFRVAAPITASLTLNEAIARAIKYNLDGQVARMEEALQYGLREQAKYDMLPQLTAQAGYNVRSNEDASVSKIVSTGVVGTDHATSSDQSILTSDLQLVWSFLDFGVAYLNAQDQDQRAVIAIQQRRQSIQAITTQVQSAYWKAAAAQKHLPQLHALINQAEHALNQSRSLERRQIQSPMEALDYQQNLLESLEGLIGLSNDLEQAQQALAQLIHLPPGAPFTLTEQPDVDQLDQIAPLKLFPDGRVGWMESYALQRSAPLWQSELELSIAGNAIRKELFSLFPGLSLNSGAHHTSNSFTFNPSWLNVGLTLAWNVFNVLSAPERINNAKQQRAIARMRRLTTAMSIITQLHLARQQYHNRYQSLEIADDLLRIQKSKQRITEAQLRANLGTAQQQTQNRADTIFAEIKRDLAYAEMQNALGQLYHSLGMDPVNHDVATTDLTTLTHFIQSQRNHNHYQILRGAITPPTPAATEKKRAEKRPYSVQVGVYQIAETARVLAMALRRQGYAPILWKERWQDGSIWHHVILGQHDNITAAKVLASDLAHRQNIPSVTIRIPVTGR